MSNAGSEDFGKFLEEPDHNPSQRTALSLHQAAARATRRLLATGVQRRNTGRTLHLPQPDSNNEPRIFTKRELNARLDPLHESRARILDANAGGLSSEAAGLRIFSREQMRNFAIPNPPASSHGSRRSQKSSRSQNRDRPDQTLHNTMLQWRLRGLQPPEEQQLPSFTTRPLVNDADSDRFTLGSFKTSVRGGGSRAGSVVGSMLESRHDGTTTELRSALDSRYIRPKRSKTRRRHIVDPVKEEEPDEPDVLRDLGKKRGDLPNDQSLILGNHDEDVGDAGGGDNDINVGDAGLASDAVLTSPPESSLPGEAMPSKVSSNLSPYPQEQLFVTNAATGKRRSIDTAAPANVDEPESSDQPELPDENQADNDEGIRRRPRDPHDIEAPLIYEVPVDEIPTIDWGQDDVDVDGEYLHQQLEHSESESEDESDAGSIAEMIEEDSDDSDASFQETEEAGVEKSLRAWEPKAGREAKDESSDEDSDENSVTALTESEDENSHEYVDTPGANLADTVVAARRQRPKRNRIPTVKFWLGERIEYETDAKTQLMTAIDVRRVEPPKKSYRRRRPYKRRTPRVTIADDDMEAEQYQEDVQVPIFDSNAREWRDRTVARSINGLKFGAVEADDGSRLPLISRCLIAGGSHESAALRISVLRIEPGGMYSLSSEQNKASTFVVWRGKCTVHLNNHMFDLSKGMACLVPRGNDFFVDNGSSERLSTGDVYLFVTEVNANSNPDLADALAKDAQSMISGAAAFSTMFESDQGSEADDSRSVQNDDPLHEPVPELDHDDENRGGGDVGDDLDLDLGSAADLASVPTADGLRSNGQALQQHENNSFQTETFVPGFTRAMRSNSNASSDQNAQPPAPPPPKETRSNRGPGSVDSLSMALGSEHVRWPIGDTLAGPPTHQRVPLSRPEPLHISDEDSVDILSDYLDGHKGDHRRFVLRERPVEDPERLRIREYIRQSAGNRSETSHTSR